jgi:phage terminase small subunit
MASRKPTARPGALLGPEEIRRRTPDWLSEGAKAAWSELAETLGERGLTPAELVWLEAAAEAVAARREAQARLTAAIGPAERRAAQAAFSLAVRLELRLLRDGGITPATRKRVETPSTQDDLLAELLGAAEAEPEPKPRPRKRR